MFRICPVTASVPAGEVWAVFEQCMLRICPLIAFGGKGEA